MFDQLNKYKKNDHFFFNSIDSLEEKCNAPAEMDGVYLVYELKNGRINLVYVGASGKRVIGPLKDGLIGLKESIINGLIPAKTPRSQAWPVKMLSENIDALDIYWWVTYKGNLKDHPESVANTILNSHRRMFDELPTWNKKE
jgi:hypothetical protein